MFKKISWHNLSAKILNLFTIFCKVQKVARSASCKVCGKARWFSPASWKPQMNWALVFHWGIASTRLTTITEKAPPLGTVDCASNDIQSKCQVRKREFTRPGKSPIPTRTDHFSIRSTNQPPPTHQHLHLMWLKRQLALPNNQAFSPLPPAGSFGFYSLSNMNPSIWGIYPANYEHVLNNGT